MRHFNANVRQKNHFFILFYLEAFTKLKYILQTFITDTRARMRGQRTDTKSRRGKPHSPFPIPHSPFPISILRFSNIQCFITIPLVFLFLFLRRLGFMRFFVCLFVLLLLLFSNLIKTISSYKLNIFGTKKWLHHESEDHCCSQKTTWHQLPNYF